MAGSFHTEPRPPLASWRRLGAAGTALEWPSGSRGRLVRWLPCTVYQIPRAFGLPPRGLAVGLLSLLSEATRSPAQGALPPLRPHSRGGRASHGPAFGLARLSAPLRPLGLDHPRVLSNRCRSQGFPGVVRGWATGTFEPLPVAGIPRGCSWAGWVGLRPPPPWRGVAPAPPSWATDPSRGFYIFFV